MLLRRRALFAAAAAGLVALTAGAGPADALNRDTVQILSPTAGNVLRGSGLELDIHVTDYSSSVGHSIRASIGGQKLTLTPVSACLDKSDCDESFSFSSIGVADGDQTLQVTVMDSVGQMAFDTEEVRVDNPVPVATNLTLTTPLVGNAVYGTAGLQADATEAANPLGAVIAGMRFYYDNALVSEDDQAPYSASASVTPTRPGTAVFSAAAVDTAGDVGPLVNLDELSETPPSISFVSMGPGSSPSAWAVDPNAYIDFNAAAMPSQGTSHLNYLRSEQLLIDGVVRDTATPGARHDDPSFRGNCMLGCPMEAEEAGGANLLSLTNADAGWRTVELRATDTRGGVGDVTHRIYIDPGPTVTITRGHDLQQVASGSTLMVAAKAVAGGPTTLGQTDATVDGKTGIAAVLCNEHCGRSTTIRAWWHVPALAVGTHTIAFSATSSAYMSWVTKSFRIVVVPSTVVTLGAATARVHHSGTARFIGRLNRLGGSGLSGEVVVLQRRNDVKHPWQPAAQRRTNGAGKVKFSVRIRHSTQWRLVFAGAKSYLGSSSKTVAIAIP